MIDGKDKEETIRLTMQGLGISRFEAEFIWAIEHDETKGDIVIVTDEGNEIKPAD